MSNYASYLRSEHWRETRADALKRADHECESCGAFGSPLQVHHLTYERVGKERPDDLQVLCRSCHAAEHPDADWKDSTGYTWLSESSCPVCSSTISRVERIGGRTVSVMCLSCNGERLEEPKPTPELGKSPREVELGDDATYCSEGCGDVFQNEYSMSQHLEDKHEWEWSDTPAGERHPRG